MDAPARLPIDVPTRETTAFIAGRVPAGASILEIGSGAGHVAAELDRRGYDVLGVEADAEAAAASRSRGVRVIEAAWPACETGPVDAIAFTRSLHHISPLGEALARARAALRPEGVLLVEDFAFDEADPATIEWFVDVLRSRTARSLILPVPHEFVTELLSHEDPVAGWLEGHDPDHDLHPIGVLTRAVAARFDIVERASAPYLYRYLVPVLPESPAAAAFVEEVREVEERLGELGEIVPVGRRLVARHASRRSVEPLAGERAE